MKKFKIYYRAASEKRNLILLAAVAIISLITWFLPFTLIGLAGYAYFVMQTLKSEKFQKKMALEAYLEHIQGLSSDCENTYREVYGKVDNDSRNHLDNIINKKRELESYFFKNMDSDLNKTIIEQTFQLVMAYSKLLHTYTIRQSEVNALDVNSLLERINRNNRKLGTLESYDAVLKLTQAIEIDERLIKEIQEEKSSIEVIGAKLDHIESMISTFKHQIISSDKVNPAVEDIESILNEAMALNRVLRDKEVHKL